MTDTKKLLQSQMVSFSDSSLKGIIISVSQLINIFDIRYREPRDDHTCTLKPAIIIKMSIGQNLGIIEYSTNEEAFDSQKRYTDLINYLRTLVQLNNLPQAVQLIEDSALVDFVDRESLKLVEEAIK